MKKVILFIVLMFSIGAFAQAPINGKKGEMLEQRKDQRKKLDSLKMDFINKNLELTADEQTKFWPIYNEMNKKMREANKKQNQLRLEIKNSTETATEADLKAKIEALQNAEQEKLNVKKDYSPKIAAIITWKKSLKLVSLERQFRDKLKEELEKRKAEKNN